MKLRTYLFVLAILAFLSASIGGFLNYLSLQRAAFIKAEKESIAETYSIKNLFSSFVSENLKSAKALSGLVEVKNALLNNDENTLAKINDTLDLFKDALDVNVCYVMTPEGDTIASSNRNSPNSFVGKNYGFRPYFKKAIQGTPFVYMALGVTSEKRGVYYSHPVYGEDKSNPIGIVIIKSSVEFLERELKNRYPKDELTTLITGPNGVVFIANNKDFLFRTTWKTSDAEIDVIKKTRQFGKGPWNWIGFQKKNENRAFIESEDEYLFHQMEIANYPGWSVFHFTNLGKISESISDPLIRTTGFITVMLCFLVGLSVFFLYKKASANIIRQKQIEEALRSSEANYRTVFNVANDAIFIHDMGTGDIIDVNQRMCDMYGYSHEEVRELDVESLSSGIHPYTQSNVLGWLEKAIKEGPQLFEWHAKDKSGRLFWVEVNLKRAVIENKDRLLAVVRDITERKQTEEALRKSEDRYRAVSELTSDYAYAFRVGLNNELENEWVTGAFNRITGYTAEELHERGGWESLIYPEDMPIALGQFKTLISGQAKVVQYRILTKSGEVRWMRDYASPVWSDEQKRTEYIYGAVQDINETKLAEAEVKESEEKYRTAMEANPDPVIVYDVGGKVIYFNPAFTRVFGWTMEECVGKKMDQFVPEENWQETEMMREKVLSGDSFSGIETRRYTMDGEIIPVSISGAIFRDQDGNPVGSVINLRDISNQKKLESQLMQAQKLEAIGTLAGGIAHDFNNLMMGMLGNLSLLKFDMDESHPSFEKIKNIEKNIESGTRLTSQILGYARQGKYEMRSILLNHIVKDTLETFARTRKDIKIHKDFQKDLMPIEGDLGQIEQILWNLYVNASDAMPEGGDLFIKTMNLTDEEFKNRPYDPKAGDYVSIEVKDTGIGIDHKTKERIFEPFYTTKEMGRGTGLGLASVYGIVKGHGGYIDVESEKGYGTTFRISVPATKEHPVVNQENSNTLDECTGTILFVDDEELIIDVGTRMLEKLGFKVVVAKSGSEAIKIYEEMHEKIDLVILDMVMPEMNGGVVFDKLKERNDYVNVLLSSGYSIDGQAQEIMNRGCNGFIQKPFNMNQLISKIKESLNVEVC